MRVLFAILCFLNFSFAQIFDEFVKRDEIKVEPKVKFLMGFSGYYYETALFPHIHLGFKAPLSEQWSGGVKSGAGLNDRYSIWMQAWTSYQFSKAVNSSTEMEMGIKEYWDRAHTKDFETALSLGIARFQSWNEKSQGQFSFGLSAEYRFGRGFRSRPSNLLGETKITNFAIVIELGLLF